MKSHIRKPSPVSQQPNAPMLPSGFIWAHVWHRKADRDEQPESQQTIVAINSLAYANLQRELHEQEAQIKRLRAEITRQEIEHAKQLDKEKHNLAVAKMFIRVLMSD